MPVYQYKCSNCDEELEIMQKITEGPIEECGSCGGALKKLITNTSFVLKGSGWYVTDYPSSDRKKAMDKKEPASSKPDNKSAPEKETIKS